MIIMPSGVFLKVYKGLLPVHQAKNPSSPFQAGVMLPSSGRKYDYILNLSYSLIGMLNFYLCRKIPKISLIY